MLDATGSTSVLLVEDEAMIRMAVAELLTDSGFNVTEAESASEALARMRDQGGVFDAVVLDLGLPDRPGDQVVRDLRRLRHDLPIVITSGQSECMIAAAFGDDSAIRLVCKPYQHRELLLALQLLGVAPSGPVDGSDPNFESSGA